MTIAIKPIIGSNGNDQLNGGNGHELLSGRGGKVHWVSADRHEDAEGYYFIAEVRIDKHQLDSIPQLYLSSGMPAETILVTAKRSIAAYLFEPLLRGISRSLRES